MRMGHRVVVETEPPKEVVVATEGVQEDPMTEMCLDRMVEEEEEEEEDSNQEMTGRMRKWIEREG